MADEFYPVWVRVRDIPKLGIAFPALAGERPLIAFPLCLPMGWTESPPYFCSATETVADLANEGILKWRNPPHHKLEAQAATPPPPSTTPLLAAPLVPPTALPLLRDPMLGQRNARHLAYINVFVDDFLACAQGDTPWLNRVRRILFHAIGDVFRPLAGDDGPHCKEPISITKLLKGDASWETTKTILGWIIDTVTMTLTFPKSRLQRLATILADIPRSQKRLSIKQWHCLLGELWSMSFAIPGARGLFSHLQAALASQQQGRLRLARGFHDALDNFRWLRDDLQNRPTRLSELVPMTPTVVGTHDASGTGAGGVWLPRPHTILRSVPLQIVTKSNTLTTVISSSLVPIVWRARFPERISQDLVSFRNPHGSITNSDLELAGGIINDEAAAQCFDIRERTTKASTDNLAMMYWHRKGSVSSNSATACLLRIQALHQRYHRYHPLKDYIPGPKNTMADDASRLHTLSDPAFFNHFNSTYPQPQSWHLWTPTPQILSAMTSALRKQTSKPALFLLAPAPPTLNGISGSPFATNSEWILPYKSWKTPFLSSRSSCIATDMAPSPPVSAPSALALWKAPYAALAKRSRVWGPKTHGSPSKTKWISAYNGNLPAIQKKTLLPIASSQYPLPSSGTYSRLRSFPPQ
jgi:hypothetical protein